MVVLEEVDVRETIVALHAREQWTSSIKIGLHPKSNVGGRCTTTPMNGFEAVAKEKVVE